MSDLSSRLRLYVSGLWLAILLAMAMVLAVLLVGLVPATKKSFDEVQMKLPDSAHLLAQVSDGYAENWSVLLPLEMALIVGGVLIGRHVSHRTWPGNVFAGVVFLVLGGSLLYTSVALNLANSKLAEGLSR